MAGRSDSDAVPELSRPISKEENKIAPPKAGIGRMFSRKTMTA